MNYNEIGKYLEKQFGGTEFFVYPTKDLEKIFTDAENASTRIVKTSAGLWVAM